HFSLSFLFLLIPLPPTSTLFPYTTLFRSINWFATTPYLFNDGTNVFSISNYCCAGVENALYGYYVSDGTWKFTDLLTPQNVSSLDRKSTRLNSSHRTISYAVFCLKKKKK